MGITEAVVLIIFLILLLILFNIYLGNSKKIKNSKVNEKLKEINDKTKPDKNLVNNNEVNYVEDSSFADDFTYTGVLNSSPKPEFKEVSENEISEPLKGIGIMRDGFSKSYAANDGDRDADLATMMFDTPIPSLNDIDGDITSAEIYEVSSSIVDVDGDDKVKQSLINEFKTLSPEMKTFIIANVINPKSEE